MQISQRKATFSSCLHICQEFCCLQRTYKKNHNNCRYRLPCQQNSEIDYSRKKTKHGGWGYGISRGVREIAWGISRGGNQKWSGISKGDQEKIMESPSRGLAFCLFLEFPKDLTKMCGISMDEALFCLEIPAVK